MDWSPVNLTILAHPMNWLLVAIVLILLCVLIDAVARYHTSQQSS